MYKKTLNKTRILLFTGLTIVVVFSCNSSKENRDNDGLESEEIVETTALPSFMIISDVHLNSNMVKIISEGGGYCVDSTFSDTGLKLWDSAKVKINALVSPSNPHRPKFILYLGDLPAHSEAINHNNNRSDDIGKVLHDLREISTNNCIPLVYAPGNNDGLGGDYHSFENKSGLRPFSQDKGYSSAWPVLRSFDTTCLKPGTIPELIDTSQLSMGYYSAYPLGKSTPLRCIALNTVIFTVETYVNDHGPIQSVAAFDQLTWLKVQLSDATKKGEAVYLMMHIPPGNDYQDNPDWSQHSKDGKTILQTFLNLVSDADCISGVFYSHTHMDELKMLLDSNETFSEFAISCPGITPQHCNNPGFKVVTYDPNNNFELMDFTTIWSDFFGHYSAQPFSNSYTFSSAYQKPSNMTMHHFLDSLNQVDQDAIKDGMGKTYYVKREVEDSPKIEQAIWVRY